MSETVKYFAERTKTQVVEIHIDLPIEVFKKGEDAIEKYIDKKLWIAEEDSYDDTEDSYGPDSCIDCDTEINPDNFGRSLQGYNNANQCKSCEDVQS